MILLKYPLHLLSEAVIAKLYTFGNMNHVYVVLDDIVWRRGTCQESQFFLTVGLQSLQSRKRILGKNSIFPAMHLIQTWFFWIQVRNNFYPFCWKPPLNTKIWSIPSNTKHVKILPATSTQTFLYLLSTRMYVYCSCNTAILYRWCDF